MSTAFTTLNSSTDLCDKTWANEIIQSYSEHRQILGQSAVSALSGTEQAPDKTLWLAMQTWLETYCTSFVDHVNGPFEDANKTHAKFFSLPTWRAAAGLNANGFTRNTDGGIVYGKIQATDHRTVTNFQELQAGFSLLRWTAASASPGNTWQKIGQAGSSGGCDIARDSAVAAFVSCPWTVMTAQPYAVHARIFTDFTTHTAINYRYKTEYVLNGISTVVSHAIELYGVGSRDPANPPGPFYVYEDIDNLFGAEYTRSVLGSLGDAITTTRTIMIGDIDTPPLSISSWAVCPLAASGVEGSAYVNNTYDYTPAWLLKWNFTYQN